VHAGCFAEYIALESALPSNRNQWALEPTVCYQNHKTTAAESMTLTVSSGSQKRKFAVEGLATVKATHHALSFFICYVIKVCPSLYHRSWPVQRAAPDLVKLTTAKSANL
jgi:hypothetical protein